MLTKEQAKEAVTVAYELMDVEWGLDLDQEAQREGLLAFIEASSIP